MPPTSSPPSLDLTRRQEEFVQAAIELVRAEGWSALTLRRLAARLGVSDPALYRHFAGKGDLALAVAARMRELLLEPVRRLALDPALSPRQRLERMLSHHLDLILATDGLPVLLVAEASTGDAGLAAHLRATVDEYAAHLGACVTAIDEPASSAAAGDWPTAEERVLQLVALPAVIALRCRLQARTSSPASPEPARLHRLLRRHVDCVLGETDAGSSPHAQASAKESP